DVFKTRVLGPVTGTPGQQLLVGQLLSRRIADEKLRIADTEGFLAERRDVIVAPFTGPYGHLFEKLDDWAKREQTSLRAEVKSRVGI
ncbi:MAG TPA: hypothetical protein VIU63_03520, partial [Nitrospira sp.]